MKPFRANWLRLCFFLLSCLPTSSPAQFQHLWSAGLTNYQMGSLAVPPYCSYRGTAVDVDRDGNTIIGGAANVVDTNLLAQLSVFVAKFGPDGNLLWRTFIGTNATAVESLCVDQGGDIYFTLPLLAQTPSPVALVMMSSGGREIWRVVKSSAIGCYQASGSTSDIRIDSAENPVLYCLVFEEQNHPLSAEVSKYSPAGNEIWRTTLPGEGLIISGPFGIGGCLTALRDGSVAVTGTFPGSGFSAKLDSKGNLLWWTQNSGYYSSIAANHRGAICVGFADGATVLNPKGIPFSSGSNEAVGDVIGTTLRGGFLLQSSILVSELSATGQLRWQTHTSIHVNAGLVSDGMSGWVGAGDNASALNALRFVQLDRNGQLICETNMPGHCFPLGMRNGAALHLVSDGTFRLVRENRTDSFHQSLGILVDAYALDTDSRSRGGLKQGSARSF